MKHSWRSSLCLLAGCLLLTLAGQSHTSLVGLRKDFQLQTVAPEDTTPLVALTTVAFGGFRGLVADVLWLRASDLQEEGQYFELVQLSRWIAQLEPRIPEVWSFQSWNLAYNISVLFPNPEDRWRWVSHGINLLKKEGRVHNPDSASLHWDIGWMYQHKIGMLFDDAHPYYRRELAREVETVLPEGLLPETIPDTLAVQLETSFAMRLEGMEELDRHYGPLDWRVPEAHSLYWATEGTRFVDDNAFQTQSLRRMKFSSLRMLLWKGNLLGDPATSQSTPLPRPELIPILMQEMKELYRAEEDLAFMRSYESFLIDAMVLRAEMGQMDAARSLHTQLAELSGDWQSGDRAFAAWVTGLRRQDPKEMLPDHALLRVTGLLLQAAAWEPTHPTRAKGLRSIASQTHRLYQDSLDTESEKARLGLPPFDLMRSLLEESGK